MMKVRRVMVLAPTKSRMLPKFGMVCAMNKRMIMLKLRNKQRFQLKSEMKKNHGRIFITTFWHKKQIFLQENELKKLYFLIFECV
jgi:hypothetical protein